MICRFLTPAVLSTIEKNSQQVGGDYRFTLPAILVAVGFAIVLAVAARLIRYWSSRLLSFLVSIPAVLRRNYSIGRDGSNLPATTGALPPGNGDGHLPCSGCGPGTTLGYRPAELPAGYLGFRCHRVRLSDSSGLPICPPTPAPGRGCQHVANPGSALDRQPSSGPAHHGIRGGGVLVQRLRGQSSAQRRPRPDRRELDAARCRLHHLYRPKRGGSGRPDFRALAEGLRLWRDYGPGAREAAITITRSSNPSKFDGLLPLIWREGGESVYQVPLRTPSLAHVIPSSAVVSRRPIHGLDVADVQTYVAALEDPGNPPASVQWLTPEHARILASVDEGQVISMQMSYDRDWIATNGSAPGSRAHRSTWYGCPGATLFRAVCSRSAVYRRCRTNCVRHRVRRYGAFLACTGSHAKMNRHATRRGCRSRHRRYSGRENSHAPRSGRRGWIGIRRTAAGRRVREGRLHRHGHRYQRSEDPPGKRRRVVHWRYTDVHIKAPGGIRQA